MDEKLVTIPPNKEEAMIKQDIWLQVKLFDKDGSSKSEIARLLGIDWKTVQKAISEEKIPSYPSRIRISKLNPFKDYIKIRLNDGVTNAVKLLREIKQRGYTGGISILRDFVLPLRQEQKRQAWIRFETMPGEQAQVDWAHFLGEDPDGIRYRFYCFTMLLGYSRCLYAEFVPDMELLTLLRCHINAFEYFGGHTKTILYDNMKQVILYRDETTGTPHFHPRFLDFAQYYSFQPKLCQPGRPQTKGKDENSIKYIRNNFYQGEKSYTLFTLNGNLRGWLDTVANVRIHATTREMPFERLKQEHLIPIPSMPYDTSRIESRIATKDCFISYHGNRYSIPFQYVRKALTIKDNCDGWLRIYDQDKLIATHKLGLDKGRMIIDPAHVTGLRAATHRQKGLLKSLAKANQEWRRHLAAPVLLKDVLNDVLVEVEKRSLTIYENLIEEE
jgi:transposase